MVIFHSEFHKNPPMFYQIIAAKENGEMPLPSTPSAEY